MAKTRTLQVLIAGDTKDLERATRRASGAMDRLGKDTSLHARVTSRGFSGMAVAARGMAAAAAGAMGAGVLLGKSFVTAASDINESLTKNQVLFGSYARDVDAFSKRSATAFGISRKAALEYTGVFGNLFSALGVSGQESAKFSTSLTKLAADMASFNNTSIEDALEAIRSGLVGETEPLRRFGVNLNDATLRQQAMSMGLTHTTKNVLTPFQKAMASQALIVKQTEKAHGDFARTQGGLANQTRILKARFSDISAELGAKLLPTVVKAVGKINDLFDAFSNDKGSLGKLRAQVAGIRRELDRLDSPKEAKSGVGKWAERNEGFLRGFRRAAESAAAGVGGAMRDSSSAVVRNVARMAKSVALFVGGISSLFKGDWSSAWRQFSLAAITQVQNVTGNLRGAASASLKLSHRIGTSIKKGITDGIGNIGHAILNKLKGGIDWAADKAKGLADKFNPFGDGIGKRVGDGIGIPSGGTVGPGGLMGADADLAPFAAAGAGMGLHISSGMRGGAITSSGNKSFHSSGDAIDMAGPFGSMKRFASSMYHGAGGRLRELISPWAGLGIKDGKPFKYSPALIAQHSGANAHVHLAYTGPFGDGIGEIKQLWTRAGGSPTKAALAAAVAMAESGGRPGASNNNTDGSIDRGLWQINSIHGGLSTFNRAANARAAVKISGNGSNWNPWVAFKSGAYKRFLTAGSGGGGGGAGGKSKPRGPAGSFAGGGGFEQTLADIDVKEASGGRNSVIDYERAFTIRQRVNKIKRALKGRLSKPTRLRLTQELGQLTGDLAALSPQAAEVADAGDGGDPNQPLIDAINAKAEQDAQIAAEQKAATEAHTAELKNVGDQMKRANNIADATLATDNYQLKKYLTDVLGGFIVGRGVVGRSFTPGTGVEYSF